MSAGELTSLNPSGSKSFSALPSAVFAPVSLRYPESDV